MSDRAQTFIDNWVSENIHATSYAPEGDKSEAKLQASALVVEAQAAGIPEGELKATVGDLTDYLASAIESAVDDEVDRAVSKDKF